MLDVALTFLVNNFNAYLMARTGGDFGKAELSRLVNDQGKWAIDQDHIGATLINIEEERVLKEQVPETRYVNGRHVVLAPPLRLNLHVLFAANLKQYDQALKYLSYVLTYFQAHPSFTQAEHPDLDPRIDRLVVELLSLTYDQLNQVWTFIGGKQLPSAAYKIRMLVLQDPEADVAVPLQSIDTEIHGR
ncbi:MAG: DUF4255 domain-containing protein [Byssovorax sp.]